MNKSYFPFRYSTSLLEHPGCSATCTWAERRRPEPGTTDRDAAPLADRRSHVRKFGRMLLRQCLGAQAVAAVWRRCCAASAMHKNIRERCACIIASRHRRACSASRCSVRVALRAAHYRGSRAWRPAALSCMGSRQSSSCGLPRCQLYAALALSMPDALRSCAPARVSTWLASVS